MHSTVIAPLPRTHHDFPPVYNLAGRDREVAALTWNGGNAVNRDFVMARGAFLNAHRITAPSARDFRLVVSGRSVHRSVPQNRDDRENQRPSQPNGQACAPGKWNSHRSSTSHSGFDN